MSIYIQGMSTYIAVIIFYKHTCSVSWGVGVLVTEISDSDSEMIFMAVREVSLIVDDGNISW